MNVIAGFAAIAGAFAAVHRTFVIVDSEQSEENRKFVRDWLLGLEVDDKAADVPFLVTSARDRSGPTKFTYANAGTLFWIMMVPMIRMATWRIEPANGLGMCFRMSRPFGGRPVDGCGDESGAFVAGLLDIGQCRPRRDDRVHHAHLSDEPVLRDRSEVMTA